MAYRVTVLPQQRNIDAAPGENLLQLLRRAGLSVDSPCGGNGRCGKCSVSLDGFQGHFLIWDSVGLTGSLAACLPSLPAKGQKYQADTRRQRYPSSPVDRLLLPQRRHRRDQLFRQFADGIHHIRILHR